MKTYRSHYCDARHRTYRTTAKCLWPRAYWIAGDGPYATTARCRPHVLTVELWPTREAAEAAMRAIGASGCGGACVRRHELIRLHFDHLEATR